VPILVREPKGEGTTLEYMHVTYIRSIYNHNIGLCTYRINGPAQLYFGLGLWLRAMITVTGYGNDQKGLSARLQACSSFCHGFHDSLYHPAENLRVVAFYVLL
jgi:hypothetical protein